MVSVSVKASVRRYGKLFAKGCRVSVDGHGMLVTAQR